MSYLNNTGTNTAGMRYLLLFFLILFTSSVDCHAAEVILSPSIRGEISYDDNISFSRISEEHDFILSILPGAGLIYRTDTLNFETGIRGNLSRFKKHDELDQNHYNLNLGASANLSERFSLNGSAVHSRESTLDSELSETGIITQRSDVDRGSLGMGLTCVLNEKSRIALNSSWFRTDYESGRNVDYDGSSASLTFSRIMNTGTDTLFLQPYFSENSSFFSSMESMGLYTGWSRDVSETFSFKAYIGARRSETSYYFMEEKNWGWLVDFSLDKTGETWKAGIALTRDLKFSSMGDPVETDKLKISFSKKFTEKFSYIFSGSIIGTESAGLINTRDTMYYSLNNSWSYLIKKDLILRLSYIYSFSHDSMRETEKNVDRNRVTVSLSYSFKEEL